MSVRQALYVTAAIALFLVGALLALPGMVLMNAAEWLDERGETQRIKREFDL
jgi:hypothetical protein